MSAPRCEETCGHGQPLPLCDACASVPRMSRWAQALTGYELANALEVLARYPRYYAGAEETAVLIEAARRIRP